jgi:hypothetical protein
MRQNITAEWGRAGWILTLGHERAGGPRRLLKWRQILLGKLGLPSDIANTMLFLASDAAACHHGPDHRRGRGSTLPESPVVLEAFYQGQ